MAKKIILAESAPKPVGCYSQAVEMDGFVFVSGVLPLDPVTGTVAGGDIKTQTEKVIENLDAILKAAKCEPEDVVKTTVFMTNLADFADMQEVYSQYFKEKFPARSTVQVVALPRGVMVEIEAIVRK